ncbi:MAG: dUTP diphosphatase [Oscillospiraceae bacterium]|nr:dUTP diphosphatase [Oscillospiraceae bacterium]
MELKIKRLKCNSILPKRATVGSAGFDLYSSLESPVEIAPGERVLIPTGIAIELPDNNYVAYIYARSGLAIKNGITLSNCVGVIDSDYRGEIKVGLINLSDKAYTINSADRIAQMVISPVIIPELVVSDDLNDTDRSGGGFGSTGQK